MGARMYGDWARAGVVLRTLATNLNPFARGIMDEHGNLILDKMKEHVARQDLSWTPLSPQTIKKKGDDTIYVETGSLIDGLTVRKIKSDKNNIVLFVGASPWKKHAPSGLKMSDLMIYLEYGTGNIPPRPLVEPTFEEVKSIIQNEWRSEIQSFIGGA